MFVSVPFSGGQGSRIAMMLFGIRCLVHIQHCRFLPTEFGSPVFWFMSESAPRLEDYIIIGECSSVIFGSCRVYSCMINPPILSSPTVSPHTPLCDCAEVCLTLNFPKCNILSIENSPSVWWCHPRGSLITLPSAGILTFWVLNLQGHSYHSMWGWIGIIVIGFQVYV